jgi:hypothetical protein
MLGPIFSKFKPQRLSGNFLQSVGIVQAFVPDNIDFCVVRKERKRLSLAKIFSSGNDNGHKRWESIEYKALNIYLIFSFTKYFLFILKVIPNCLKSIFQDRKCINIEVRLLIP